MVEKSFTNNHCAHDRRKKYDFVFITVISFASIFYFGHLINSKLTFFEGRVAHLFHNYFEILNTMSFGILIGVISVGILGKVPREYVISILGPPGKLSSILKATLAGIFLDLCSHGILLVGMKLYERGASTAQVMAFLIASPWNSFSLTVVLITLIGIKWTLLFIFLSAVVAVFSGIIFNYLESKKILKPNPNRVILPDNFRLISSIKNDLKDFNLSMISILKIFLDGLKDSKMIIKWLLFGAILSSLIQTFIAQDFLTKYFGPSLIGLFFTLIATTLIEVCSEGATPVAADLLNRAGAPGNSFLFLMAGVSTDYTEILSIKSTTKSLKIALFLPIVSVPQILILGYIINKF